MKISKISHCARDTVIAAGTLLGLLALAGSSVLGSSGWGVSAPFHLDTTTSSVDGSSGGPSLSIQAAPSPSAGKLRITYRIPKPTLMTLCIFAPSGRLVRQLVNGSHPAGEYSMTWDGRDDNGEDLPSGVYFAKIQTIEGVTTAKVTLAR